MKQYINLILTIYIIISLMTISIYSCIADRNELQSFQMKKEIYSSIIISGPQEEWNKTYGGTKWDDCSAVELTTEGGYIFAGTLNANGYDNGGDCWLVKTDSNGDVIWEKTYGGPGSDTGSDLCITHDGGYALVGYTWSFGAGGSDIYLIKTDSSGNEQWNWTFGGSQNDYGLAIQQCSDEGFIIAGGTLSFGSREAWLIKTNAAGGMEWQKRFCRNRSSGAYFMSVLRTKEEEYIAVGRNYLGDMSDSDILAVKTDRNGTVKWEKLLGNPNYKDSALYIATTSDGNYIVTGQIQHPQTEHDILLMKIDPNGDELWTRTFNESSFFDTGNSVIETHDGGFLISGELGTNSNNPVMFNAILIKTDSNGKKEWSMIFGGSGSDGWYEALQTSDEWYLVAGYSTSYGTGSQDAWLIKLSTIENQRPYTPAKPSGQSSGKIHEEYTYSTHTYDPNSDELYYFWDWGDGTTSGWLGPYGSGEHYNATHAWSTKNRYEIIVKAKDVHGAESDWSDPLTVTITKSKNKAINTSFLQFLKNFLQDYPNLFTIMQKIIKRLRV